MNNDSLELLNKMLSNFISERDEVKKQINSNLSRIKETDSFVKTLSENEDKDYKLFSPRNSGSVFQEEINRSRRELDVYEDINREYSAKLLYLDSYIDTLQKILDLENKKEFHVDSELRNKNLTVLNIQEEERQRIARDLHDTSLQNLAHLVHKLELSSMYIDQDPVRAKLELAVTSKNLKSVIEEIRNTVFDLRPMTFDDLGIKEALGRLMTNANENSEIEVYQDIDDIPCDNNLILVSIYRAVKECVSNSVKHSQCTKLSLKCKCYKNLCDILVEDNGKGFSIEDIKNKEKHFGLSVMKERVELMGGKLDVVSNINQGTRTHLQVPLN